MQFKYKHILASVGAIQVLVPYSVYTRFNPIAYKGISLLGLSHDPSSYLGEIGCRSSTQTRKRNKYKDMFGNPEPDP